MSNHSLFIGGVPTEPDVKRLIDAFPSIASDIEITHAEISKILGVDAKSARYRTITSAWRRLLLRVHNVRMSPIAGIGYRVIDGIERVTENVKQYGRGARQIQRAARDIRATDRRKLDQEQQRVTEHVLRHMDATADHLRRVSKEMAIEFKPQAQLPRVRMVK